MSLARAIETGDLGLLPSRRDEDWKWTDLRGLVRALPSPSPANESASGPGPFQGLAGEEVLIVNGGRRSLAVGAGERRTVALRFVAAADAGAHAGRVEIDLAADADLVLLESYEGEAADYVVENDLVVTVGRNARLDRIVLAADAPTAVSVSTADIILGPGSAFAQTVVTSGAKRQRLETRLRHPGGGASARLDGIYLLGDRRHADITTSVTHEGVDGRTDQLVKGVVDGQARGVFQGRILVSRGADRTDAKMGHHGLVLSDRAEIDAKPELEIYADDVACAHGATVGSLDEEAIFYARQRGMSEAEARGLLTLAFVGAVIDRVEHADAREVLRAWAARLLDAQSSPSGGQP